MSNKRSTKDFQIGDCIGEGSYSKVYKATSIHTHRVHAIKVLSKRHIVKEKKIKYVNIEKETLNRLGKHAGIVTLYYTFQDVDSLYFVIDYAHNGELLSLVRKLGSFSEKLTQYYMAQLVDAVDFIHSKGVIHRDLKPENLLLTHDWKLMITDFGAAKILDPSHEDADISDGVLKPPGSFVGTAEYVSPELLKYNHCGFECDIWALGCILFQLIVGRAPFKGTTEYLTFEKIIKLDFQFPSYHIPVNVKDLVSKILVLNIKSRFTLQQVQNHPWFRNIAWEDKDSIWKRPVPPLVCYNPRQGSSTIAPRQSSSAISPRQSSSTIAPPRQSSSTVPPRQSSSPSIPFRTCPSTPQSSPVVASSATRESNGDAKKEALSGNKIPRRGSLEISKTQESLSPPVETTAKTSPHRHPKMPDKPSFSPPVPHVMKMPLQLKSPSFNKPAAKLIPAAITSKLRPNEKLLKLDQILKTEIGLQGDVVTKLDDETLDGLIKANYDSLNNGIKSYVMAITSFARLLLFDSENHNYGFIEILLAHKKVSMYDYEFDEAEGSGCLVLELTDQSKMLFFLPCDNQTKTIEFRLNMRQGWIECLLRAKKMVQNKPKPAPPLNDKMKNLSLQPKIQPKRQSSSSSQSVFAAAAAAASTRNAARKK